ncbi:cysteine--tRNA ligase [Oscillatoria acuminata]|uniref:Cysteine--tRNA ligase n=1 Tax=Oscillatoria acuminata PCC 6304 TaxID=56110 RepID=K9TST8_9CYAN|nr:cysteine--tRNA ligase [Oscillatoria acuminata]AFY85079.1 cysteinyl-tRNA synthetase [Oscillatoria acuminata PCC 6304]
MTLTLYNTLTRRQEPFIPFEPGQVRMYCCGVTVYDYCHLGHARSYIIWDILRRYLQWRGYAVRYVQNFTDIDDKILNRARQEGTSMEAVADRYTQAYFEDMARLNVLEADAYPRATHTLDGIKRLIAQLEQKGFAYPAGGDVYYKVRKFADYGKLSGRQLAEMQAGASGRVEAEDPEELKKQDPFDFALWKAAKPGEPSWESPWGAGRPGWHIECSAMVREVLGETIDIHVGGADLIFPHHENEIAQSEAVTGQALAKYWLHNGMVAVNGEKMSKSLGNFTTIRQLLDQGGVDPMALRLFVLQANYRKPLDFTDEAIASAENGWTTLKDGLRFGYEYGSKLGWDVDSGAIALESDAIVARFQTAMDDDLNTPSALAVLFELAKELRRQGNIWVHEGKPDMEPEELHHQWVTLRELGKVLGLEVNPIEENSASEPGGLSDQEIESLIQDRLAARQGKNFAEADRIRNQLQELGITLIDKPGGVTQWHRN